MNERETVNKLDYLIRKLELPEEQDSKLRGIVRDAFFVGNNYFIENIDLEYVTPPFWKFLGQSCIRSVYLWDSKKLNEEFKKYLEEGTATGDLTKRIDYILISVKPSPEHSKIFRKIVSATAVSAGELVTSNISIKSEWDEYEELKYWHENEIDYKLLDKYFDSLKTKQLIKV